MHNLDELLGLASEIAVSAGEILLEGRRSGFGAIDTKSTTVDIVTEIDKASEQHIVARLTSERPDDGILGEEGTSIEGTSGVRWIIDPLDGTVNFTYGIPSFAVSIGAEVDGVPAVGVVLNPVTCELFKARVGGGAFVGDQAISAGEQDSLELSLVGTGFSYSKTQRAVNAQVLTHILPEIRDIRRSGSAALDLCSVACGRLDGYFEMQVNPWDICAGIVIATEAGAVVTSFDGGKATHDAVAANRSLQPQLLTLASKAVANA